MAYTEHITIWDSDSFEQANPGKFVETHGGENNGAARRVFCPANGKYAKLPGLGLLDGVRCPTFYSGNPADLDMQAGQKLNFDYVAGMPDLRLEHFHVIDTKGADYLTLHWRGECILYEGLVVSLANEPPNPTDLFISDTVSAVAFGVPTINPDNDFNKAYLNFPAGVWRNRRDLMNFNPLPVAFGANFQVLSQHDFTATTNWAAVNGFSVGAGVATYVHNAAGGTLTQLSANFLPVAVPPPPVREVLAGNRPYRFIYTMTGLVGTVQARITTTFASTITNLTMRNGVNIVDFTSAASPGNFVIEVAAGASAPGDTFTLDNLCLYINRNPGSNSGASQPNQVAGHLAFQPNQFIAEQFAMVCSGMRDRVNNETVYYQNGYLNLGLPNNAVGRGALQEARLWRDAEGMNYKLPTAGDVYNVSFQVGRPPIHAALNTTSNPVASRTYEGPLRISGFDRIFVAISSGAIPWDATTRITSNPIAPAVAPRQLIRGKWVASLTHAGGRSR